jgi:hypothetical protein
LRPAPPIGTPARKKKRLGASTDDADAMILAWHKREDALRQADRAAARGGAWARADGWGFDARLRRGVT